MKHSSVSYMRMSVRKESKTWLKDGSEIPLTYLAASLHEVSGMSLSLFNRMHYVPLFAGFFFLTRILLFVAQLLKC